MSRDDSVPTVSGQVRDFSSPVSANLVSEMERTGRTIAEVAAALRVGERQITRWRAGQEPRFASVAALAQLFGREVAWFYTDHVEPRNGDREAA